MNSGLFLLLSVMNSAAVNVRVQIFGWVSIFSSLGWVPGRGIAGPSGDSGFNVQRCCPTVSHGLLL